MTLAEIRKALLILLLATPLAYATDVELAIDGIEYACTPKTAPTPDARISQFSVNPASANKGSNLTATFRWTSENAIACRGSWTGSSNLPTTGSTSLAIRNLQSTQFYTLTCEGLSSTDTAAAKIVATNVIPPTPGCNVNLSGRTTSWEFNYSAPFPFPTYAQKRIGIPEGQYYAVSFNTKSIRSTGAVGSFEASASFGNRRVAISETRGCFDVQPQCQREPRREYVSWSTEGTAGTCPLKSNTTYYVNYSFTDSAGAPTCRGYCEAYIYTNN